MKKILSNLGLTLIFISMIIISSSFILTFNYTLLTSNNIFQIVAYPIYLIKHIFEFIQLPFFQIWLVLLIIGYILTKVFHVEE